LLTTIQLEYKRKKYHSTIIAAFLQDVKQHYLVTCMCLWRCRKNSSIICVMLGSQAHPYSRPYWTLHNAQVGTCWRS